MKLLLVLIGVTFVLSYKIYFRGCTHDGWSCRQMTHLNHNYEITYRCHESLPISLMVQENSFQDATVVTIRDCVELTIIWDFNPRLDGLSRSPTLRVVNVTRLSHTYSDYHSNRIPYNLYISDVANINFFNIDPKTSTKISSLVLNNVHINGIMGSWFVNLTTRILEMRNVVIEKIDSEMFIVANVTVMGMIFPLIPTNGAKFWGENVLFFNNTFKTIHTNGLTIKSKEFKFSNNYVHEIKSQGLNLLGTKIKITKNVFNHLEMEAFQNIIPGYLPSKQYEIGFKFAYIFTENIIKNINPGSLHFNWKMYQQTCSDLQFKNNVFDCSCLNFGWMTMFHSLGPKLFLLKEFYDMYLFKEDNYCSNQDHCPINAILSQIQDVCNNKTNISMACSSFNSSTEPVTLTSLDSVTMAVTNVQGEKSEKQMFLTKQIEVTEKIIPVLSYSENQTSHLESTGLPVWFIVILVIVLLTAISTGLFMFWYKKKKQGHMIITSYRNERGEEVDNVVMINEHHNELYNKQ